MTPEQMRELADELDTYVGSPTRASYYPSPVLRAADFLRQCAEQRPVAWRKDLDPPNGNWTQMNIPRNPWPGSPHVQALYAAPLPQSTNAQREPLSDEQIADAQPVAPVALVRAYNAGYMAGHHDTVEGGFVDIHPSDMDTYHADVVAELGLPAAPQAEPKREPLSADEILDIATAAGLQISMYIDDVETRAAIKRLARAIERAHGIGGSDE